MTTAQVVETSVTNNSLSEDSALARAITLDKYYDHQLQYTQGKYLWVNEVLNLLQFSLYQSNQYKVTTQNGVNGTIALPPAARAKNTERETALTLHQPLVVWTAPSLAPIGKFRNARREHALVSWILINEFCTVSYKMEYYALKNLVSADKLNTGFCQLSIFTTVDTCRHMYKVKHLSLLN